MHHKLDKYRLLISLHRAGLSRPIAVLLHTMCLIKDDSHANRSHWVNSIPIQGFKFYNFERNALTFNIEHKISKSSLFAFHIKKIHKGP